MAEMVFYLESEMGYVKTTKLKIYKYEDSYSLVWKSNLTHYYNDGRKLEKEYRRSVFIFESDIGKGMKRKIEITRWFAHENWMYDEYINKIAFRYGDEDEWKHLFRNHHR